MMWVIGIIVVLAIAGGAYWYLGSGTPSGPAAPTTSQATSPADQMGGPPDAVINTSASTSGSVNTGAVVPAGQ